ncbi:hypothetical protein Tco_0129111, partial [Tanacetum coccineum]
YGYIRNHKKTVKKRASTDTRIRRVQKEAKDSKPKPEMSSLNTMADMSVPVNDALAEQAPAIAPPTRTDDQILPLSK